MTKLFCDMCKEEISSDANSETSVYIFIEWRMILDKGMQPFKKQEEYCDKCTTHIKQEIDKLRKK